MNNEQLIIGLRECAKENHKRRDNSFGVTWCVRCGRLFTKPCGVALKESDKVILNLESND